jgi:hypothetical protein
MCLIILLALCYYPLQEKGIGYAWKGEVSLCSVRMRRFYSPMR